MATNTATTYPQNPYVVSPNQNTSQFVIAPQPQGAYSMAHGGVPGLIGVPDVAAQLEAQLPENPQLKKLAAQDVMSQLRGELNPDTVDAIQRAQAQWGVNAGVPGAGLAVNKGLRDIGLMSEQLQQQGLQNYSTLAQTVSNTQTVKPETQMEAAIQNAINLAAPNPQSAASYSQALFNKYMEQSGPQTQTVMTDVWKNGMRTQQPMTIPKF